MFDATEISGTVEKDDYKARMPDLRAQLVGAQFHLKNAGAPVLIVTTTLSEQRGFGSVYGMTPGSVLVQTLARTPITEGVKAHSIIPVRGDGPIEIGDDGVVQYKSAHIEGVESEYIVRSGHSTQADPHTIEEVRRILLLHWAESCTKRGNCGQAPARPPLIASKSR
jgi:hypothetical protein